MNKIPYILGENAVTLFVDGKPVTVRNDDANYYEVRKCLLDGRYDEVTTYLDLEKQVEDYTDGDISIKDGEVFFGEEKLNGVVVDKLLELMKSGLTDKNPFINFLKNLLKNPSKNSVDQLYTFLSKRDMPIDEEGLVIGYKGVAQNYKDKFSGKFDNSVGQSHEMPRRNVDDDCENHCSYGFHIGSYDYANDWASGDGHLMIVKFNPEDAVSVPNDCDFQKLRVCKYSVVGEITERKQLKQPFYDSTGEFSDEDYDDDIELEDYENDSLDNDSYESDATRLAIRNYIENKHEDNTEPTVKQIQSRMKGTTLTSQEIVDIVEELGFEVEYNKEALSRSRVVIGEDISITN